VIYKVEDSAKTSLRIDELYLLLAYDMFWYSGGLTLVGRN